MRYARLLHPRLLGGFVQSLAVIGMIFLLASAAGAQAANAQQPFSPDDLKKYSGMLTEMGQFFQKIHTDVQFPVPRSQSRLLPLLPESTVLYAGFPNYGEASHQALAVFHQELKENAKLRAWWEQGDIAKEGPKIEEALEKIYELSQYLGDEIVLGAAPSTGKEDPKFVILAEVRKPGLKDVLPKILKDFADKSTAAIRVLDVAELANAKDAPSSDQPVILVRPELVVLGENLTTLRRFNARLEQKAQGFASTEFGRRLAQGYEGGATIVAGLDMQTILKKEGPKDDKDRATFERTGFSDMKYLVWDHKSINGQETSQFELSFTGPRRGVASWLAAPGPMGSLDFVSPKAAILVSILLKDPQKIYDEAADLATASNPNALASLAQMEQGLKLSLREDLFARLDREITLELDTLPPEEPVWKILLKTRDPRGLLATLKTFFGASTGIPKEYEEDGITYYTLPIPGPKKREACYAIVEGYLIAASSHATLAEAIRLHRSGESLAKSGMLAASLPPGNSGDVSALLYEDPRAMAALGLVNVSPELANSLLKSTAENQPALVAVYGEETALREASHSSGVDFSGAMVVAAIAIPNLLRARMAANEGTAAASVRTANVAQVTYSSMYPEKGYARDLATLGPNPNGSNDPSPQHASVIDSTLGGASCTAGAWCIKSGYRFTITTACKLQKCREYVITATPVNTSTGMRNLCSTSDAVVRFQLGPPLTSPIRAAECRSWAPLQ
ncbi:MAG TPA: hypothetical protein VJP02_17245 [Candidatus Sulfotelmatobacter sp.]|nr:hypothetical protein [Candidatus Sulfotelmatobacter sp.]